MYQTRLEQFEGPLHLLLELIERRKLDISTIALADVAEQFLGYVSANPNLHPDELADFLVVAAKLLLIKSRTLLPSLAAEEDGDNDLERQLKIYREYYEASKRIERMIRRHHYSFARGASLKVRDEERRFRPPEGLVPDELTRLLRIVLKRLEPFVTISEDVIIRTVNIRDKIENIRSQILENVTMNFQTLLEQANSKTDIIVTFLAMLELVKMRAIAVVQNDMFRGITIERRSPVHASPTEHSDDVEQS
ncbi:MAG: segregation/condensation protein A [Candidatus Kerfeldbacteria bacterium]|nr:segregation/condensation protein A [Candidatus Kerfeldbacteria bacterium]